MAKSLGDARRRREKRKRDLAAHEIKMASLRMAGATCSSCMHRARVSLPGKRGHYCELHSSWDGHVIVPPDYCCPSYFGSAIEAIIS